MPFLRFSRDKRGYEHVYLIQPSARGDSAPPRMLYWFRTPPNVRIGREPFDRSARQSLESLHADLRFDWPRLLATPVPPPDADRWRERRRAERAGRRAGEAAPERQVREERPAGEEAAVAPSPAQPAGSDQSGMDAAAPGDGRKRRRRRRRGRRPDTPANLPDSAPPEDQT